MAIRSGFEKEEDIWVNLTPMIDVMLFLLIFFMLATKFTEIEREVDVHLPRTSDAQALTQPPREIVINVKQDGSMIVLGKTYTLDQLRALLTQAKASYPKQIVLMRGDEAARLGVAARVMAVCKGVGIDQINWAVVEDR